MSDTFRLQKDLQTAATKEQGVRRRTEHRVTAKLTHASFAVLHGLSGAHTLTFGIFAFISLIGFTLVLLARRLDITLNVDS